MFQLSRAESSSAIGWKPKRVQYVEAWSYSNVNESTPWNFRHGSLEMAQIEEWLHHEGNFSVPAPPTSAGNLDGGVRLLFCDRTSFHGASLGASLGISAFDFDLVESVFELHPATLPALEVDGGTYSRHFEYKTPDQLKTGKISVILKAPQKYEIANYMLSLTYDTKSQWTTAFLAGESILELASTIEIRRKIPYGFHAASTKIRTSLSQSACLWTHPLLLPCILMTDHLKRLQEFCVVSLTEQVMTIEDQLGVTRVGRRNKDGKLPSRGTTDNYLAAAERFISGEPLEKSRAMDLTIRINTQFTKILFSKRSPTWNREASKFLLATLGEMIERLRDIGPKSHQISELLEHNIHATKSVEDHVLGLQARMDLQLNVLYSFVAQTDNRLSARLAATSGRDSTAMKILALITTIFLPGTFVATVFSMSMFNWQYNAIDAGSTGGSVVSSRFWIYWAVAIPLTILTITGWALWWNFEKDRYNVDVAETLRSAEELDKPSWWRRLAQTKEKT